MVECASKPGEVGTKVKSPRLSTLIVATCLFLCACGGGGEEPSLGSATVTTVDQTGVVGTELSLPLEARLFDKAGIPLAGKTVTFVATDAGGSGFPGTVRSDADGYVRTRWTLGGFAGWQVVALSANDASGVLVTYATYGALAVPGPLARVEAIAGDHQSGLPGQPLPIFLRVRAADQFGNPIERMMISFVPQNGGISAIDNVTTGPDGTVLTTWTLGPSVGPQSMVAIATPLNPAPKISVSFAATASLTPGP